MIRIAFPQMSPKLQNRSHVHGRFNAIRILRNRVVHHEPIWKGVRLQSGKIVPIGVMYDDILDAIIGWVSPEVRDAIAALDRFPAALHRGYQSIEHDIKQYLNLS
jgi:hypothetical protein